jgi:hypothetical protein
MGGGFGLARDGILPEVAGAFSFEDPFREGCVGFAVFGFPFLLERFVFLGIFFDFGTPVRGRFFRITGFAV